MNYVETPTFRDIIKLQILGVRSLDKKTLLRLRPALIEVENQLTKELNRFSEDQFSYQKRYQTLRLISRTLNEMEKILTKEFEASAKEYFNFGQEAAEEEITAFNGLIAAPTPSIKKTKLSIEKNKFLVNNARASLATYSAQVRATVSNAITQGMLSGRSTYDITTKLSRFMDIKKWRLTRIARTESHKIYNLSLIHI